MTINIIIFFNKKVTPILFEYAEMRIKQRNVELVNECVTKIFYEKKYEDLTIITKNSNDEIIMLDFDDSKLNILLKELNNLLILKLNSLEKKSFFNDNEIFFVPVGVATNMVTFSSLGPKIPIKIITVGNIETSMNTTLSSYGINNALLEISIVIKYKNKILISGKVNNVETNKEIPVIKKILQGKVPNIYNGLYTNSSNIYGGELVKKE